MPKDTLKTAAQTTSPNTLVRLYHWFSSRSSVVRKLIVCSIVFAGVLGLRGVDCHINPTLTTHDAQIINMSSRQDYLPFMTLDQNYIVVDPIGFAPITMSVSRKQYQEILPKMGETFRVTVRRGSMTDWVYGVDRIEISDKPSSSKQLEM